MKTDNELIAEFMGYSVRYFGPVLYFSDEDGYIDFTGDARTFSPNLSWDDLMPVVKKITPIAMQIGQQAWSDIKYDLLDGSIDRVCRRVVEFIKWHNQQNQ